MADGNYDAAFEHVIGHEGGYTNDRRDRGNWTSGQIGKGKLKGTKYGISAMSYPKLDIKNLTLDDAKAIYKRDYWDRMHCDELPDGLDLVVFDTAINSGRVKATKLLQSVVGTEVDGLMGPVTVEAANDGDPEEMIDDYLDLRLDFMKQIKTWKTYGKGWTRRVEGVRTAALDMAGGDDTAVA